MRRYCLFSARPLTSRHFLSYLRHQSFGNSREMACSAPCGRGFKRLGGGAVYFDLPVDQEHVVYVENLAEQISR